ncbi:MAG: hypothetical protein AAFW73_23515 [Bacteroidota bacterium]
MRDLLILTCSCLFVVFVLQFGRVVAPVCDPEIPDDIYYEDISLVLPSPTGSLPLQFNFYKVSRNLFLIFFVLFALLVLLFLREFAAIVEEENAGQVKLRLQSDLEFRTRRGLKEQLAEKERLLTAATLALEQNDKVLRDLRRDLHELHNSADGSLRRKLTPLRRSLDRRADPLSNWTQFQLRFAQLHPRFWDRLLEAHPALNGNDLRLCAYLRLQLSSKEIAQLLGIQHHSVQKARYRLKKKLALGSHEDLREFIAKV